MQASVKAITAFQVNFSKSFHNLLLYNKETHQSLENNNLRLASPQIQEIFTRFWNSTPMFRYPKMCLIQRINNSELADLSILDQHYF